MCLLRKGGADSKKLFLIEKNGGIPGSGLSPFKKEWAVCRGVRNNLNMRGLTHRVET